MLEITDHPSHKYAPRTYTNAKTADLTVAIAVDFSTAGEWCTKKAAGKRYLSVYLSEDYDKAAARIIEHCKLFDVKTLNIAGNGIYTLLKEDVTQPMVNSIVYQILKRVHEVYPLQRIISGGQTGVDTAGIVAAVKLNIPCGMLLPKGFVRRFGDGVDIKCSPAEIEDEIYYYGNLLGLENGNVVWTT